MGSESASVGGDKGDEGTGDGAASTSCSGDLARRPNKMSTLTSKTHESSGLTSHNQH